MINWIELFEKHNIPYRTSGPNCARGHIVIKCPFCGQQDPSMHMGINLETGYWGCWRDETHRGKRPHRLLMKLLNMPIQEIEAMLGLQYSEFVNKSFYDMIKEKLQTEEIQTKRLDEEKGQTDSVKNLFETKFKKLEFNSNLICNAWYANYLISRGFNSIDLPKLYEDYDLYYTTNGEYGNRVILPIYYKGELVAFTGRAISSKEKIKYKSSSKKMGAKFNTNEILYDTKKGLNGRNLLIFEGPFDAIKFDFYAKKLGFRGTCLFGKNLHDEAVINCLHMFKLFVNIFIVMDNGEHLSSIRIMNKLTNLLPFYKPVYAVDFSQFTNKKDVGDLTPEEIGEFVLFVNQMKQKFA